MALSSPDVYPAGIHKHLAGAGGLMIFENNMK
jgi:hypothetical protein